MKLISRHRGQYRAKAPRIAISQAEITADLHYPASRAVDARRTLERRGARG
ncbi:MAG TPA: hypothetical protein VHF50_01180 [Solirubrobacterales bacterium]|nr:hypothetical protein [Solirubrobacterales bacterium]